MTQVSLSYQLDLDEHSIWITATPSQVAKGSIVYVQELGDFIAGRNYFTRRANLPSFLIKYCISGEGILEYEGSVSTVKPGQLFWIDCEKPQYYRTSSEKGNWRILWVHFYGQTARAYYELFGYYECDSVAYAAKVQRESEVVARWNVYMKDVMIMATDPQTGEPQMLGRCFCTAERRHKSRNKIFPRISEEIPCRTTYSSFATSRRSFRASKRWTV